MLPLTLQRPPISLIDLPDWVRHASHLSRDPSPEVVQDCQLADMTVGHHIADASYLQHRRPPSRPLQLFTSGLTDQRTLGTFIYEYHQRPPTAGPILELEMQKAQGHRDALSPHHKAIRVPDCKGHTPGRRLFGGRGMQFPIVLLSRAIDLTWPKPITAFSLVTLSQTVCTEVTFLDHFQAFWNVGLQPLAAFELLLLP